MLTIREIQEKTVAYFAGKGVPNPKLDTDLLIAHTLGLQRLQLYLDLNRPLTTAQLDQLRPLVKRRAAREPLQYILGEVEFCGLKLKVDSRALIPRPETEELIELLRDKLVRPPERVIDLGTGSGAIAIALAMLFPGAAVVATDQSGEALALAEENAQRCGVHERIEFRRGRWWAAASGDRPFDLVVSNPPYLTEEEMETAEPEVAANEPREALVSGKDGLDDLRQILAGAKDFLAEDGLLALETGVAQHARLDELCRQLGLSGTGIADLSGRPRFYFVGTSAD